jgi:exodeoxyribonuclease VII small subunit
VPKAVQASQGGDARPPSFEDAIQRLEAIVESMETGELPLESLLQRFEEGSRLLRSCQERLADAELKIQRLEKDLSGEPVARPIEADDLGTDTATT